MFHERNIRRQHHPLRKLPRDAATGVNDGERDFPFALSGFASNWRHELTLTECADGDRMGSIAPVHPAPSGKA
jgi:hypothetical protein